MIKYVYFTLYRPPMLGAVPSRGLDFVTDLQCAVYIESVSHYVYGMAVYNSPLSEQEIRDYELAYVGEVEGEKNATLC